MKSFISISAILLSGFMIAGFTNKEQTGLFRKKTTTTTLMLQNCSHENRTVTFTSEMNFFKCMAQGSCTLEKNRTAFFSPEYKIDSNYIRQNMEKVRRSLPPRFWTFPMGENWYSNEPNENAIWFIQAFVKIDDAGNITVFSAYKITFEGTDARIDSQRKNPKIKGIEFILEKKQLDLLAKKLKTSPEAI